MEIDQELDCSGLSCPMPVLKLSQTVKKMDSGKVLKMTGTDPGSVDDVPKWCKRTKNELLDSIEEGGKYIFIVKKV